MQVGALRRCYGSELLLNRLVVLLPSRLSCAPAHLRDHTQMLIRELRLERRDTN
jgi:hypothetical protein